MSIDPFDAATQAGERVQAYFGKVECTAQFVALVKGQGKQAWHEGMGEDTRRTELAIYLNPLDEMELTRAVERKVIAESGEWRDIVWASARDNMELRKARDLHGQWVRAEMVKTGRSFVNREGATVENTTFRFTNRYETQAECVAAYLAESGKAHTPAATAAASAPTVTANGNGAVAGSNGNDVQRMTAMQFLPALVAQAGGDKEKLAGILAGMPIISQFFTVDSPEVTALASFK